jgi:Ca-activated chloride channel family protein
MLTFAWPFIFLLLPLPWLAWRTLLRAEIQQPAALKVPFFARLKTLSASPRLRILPAVSNRQLLVALIWVLLVTALAGPQWVGGNATLPQTGRDIMIAIDLSGSMETPDLAPDGRSATRLDVVKQIAEPFIQERVGDRVGLVVFGSRAYLQAPLTFDRQTVRRMLNDATIGLAGQQTAIGDALGLAIKRLLTQPAQSRAIILLTDGGNNSGALAPLEAARVAAANHIKIYSIGIGADKMTVDTPLGPQVINPSNDLDLETLKKMSDMTGGQFYRAKNLQELRGIYDSIDKLEPSASDAAVMRSTQNLYPWFVIAAILISIFLAWPRLGMKKT